jgi:hypothetical protein
MVNMFNSKKHKLLSRLRRSWARPSLITTIKHSTSASAITVAAVTIGVAVALLPSARAFADTDYYTCDQEAPILCIKDAGLHNTETVGSASNYIGFAPEGTYAGYEEYELKINDGTDCLDFSTSGGYVYDEACSNATNKLWLRISEGGGLYQLTNVYVIQVNDFSPDSCPLTSHYLSSGDKLVLDCASPTPKNAYDQWNLNGL